MFINLISVWKSGPALFPDSVNYLHAARTLLESGSFLQFTGEPFVSWPPLYSILIASVSRLFFISYVSSAFVINVISGILTSVLLFETLTHHLKNSPFKIILAVLLALSIWPAYQLTSEIVSEPLFICLTLASFYALAIKNNWKWALLFATLAFLQRYIGVVGWISLIFWGLFHHPKKKTRALLSFVSSIPMGLWLIRNLQVSKTLTGVRSEPFIGLFENLFFGIDIVTKWFFPHSFPIGLRLTLFVLILILASILSIRVKNAKAPKIALSFSAIYFISIWLISTSGASEALSFRLLSPLYPFLLISLFYGLFLVDNRFTSFISVLFCMIGIYQIVFLSRLISDKNKNGSGGFARLEWTSSETMNWVNTLTEQPKHLVSNAADAIYARTEQRVALSPFWYERDKIDVILPHGSTLVWFNQMNRKTAISLDSLKKFNHLVPLHTFSDGSVWHIP